MALRSFAIVCGYMETGLFAIVCDLRSAIHDRLRSYGNQPLMLLPTNGCSLELCIPFLKLNNKEQAFISWQPGPLAANVTRNMIGAAANSYMIVAGSQ